MRESKTSLTPISNTDQVMTQIIQAMKERRKELGYSQRYLGECVGVTRGSIACIEGQTITPRFEVVLKMCEALDLTIDVNAI